MGKSKLNICNVAKLQQIPESRLLHYWNHRNYKLNQRFVLVRSMFVDDDDEWCWGKVSLLAEDGSDTKSFHIELKDQELNILTSVKEKEVMIFFDSNKEETEFTPRFVYWDEKHVPVDGINIKNLVGMTRLDALQLSKYIDDYNWKLRNRRTCVRSKTIAFDTIIECVLSTCPILADDQLAIIMDKNGINPKFIYYQ
ncbi:MAG: hypothetical protein WCG25_09055 [bacterium]